MQIARDLGYEVVERDIARGELYLADEIFMTGTAAELTPIREIDDHPVGTGQPGPVTREVQSVFEDALHGRAARYAHWNDLVEAPRAGRRDRLRHDASRRHAGRGHVALGRGEAAGRPQARRPRRPHGRGRLPGVEPQGGGVLRPAVTRDAPHGAGRRVRDDAPARHDRRRRPRAARCWPTRSRRW